MDMIGQNDIAADELVVRSLPRLQDDTRGIVIRQDWLSLLRTDGEEDHHRPIPLLSWRPMHRMFPFFHVVPYWRAMLRHRQLDLIEGRRSVIASLILLKGDAPSLPV
jgi:hypothetical protein